MSSSIPFLKTQSDVNLFNKIFADSKTVRIPVRAYDEIAGKAKLPNDIWIDTEIEGFVYEAENRDDRWEKFMANFPGYEGLSNRSMLENPKNLEVEQFVNALLNFTLERSPTKITVPQIPFTQEINVGKINRKLAQAAGKWRASKGRKIQFITPVVLTNQKQYNLKTDRNKIVSNTKSVYELSDSCGIWIVDSSLVDQKGTGNFASTRFKGLSSLSEELNLALNTNFSVAGPYWALNILLWAKGNITNPAISIGNSFCYYIAGKKGGSSPNIRIALPPLLRWAIANQDLKNWLSSIQGKFEFNSNEDKEFRRIQKEFEILSIDRDAARRQIALFYKSWLDRIENISIGGRSLALYQEFSTAYIIGKGLPALSSAECSARRPEKIAEQFMINCL